MLKSMLAIPALVLCLCGVGTSQDPEAGNKVHSISVDVTRVVLYATVREDKSAIVGDLAKEQFTVLEDGKPQEILSFGRDDVPVAIGLLVDNSGSMMNKRPQVIEAAKSFLRATNPMDEIFVLHFNESLTYGLPGNIQFTSDQVLLGEALDRAQQTGRTALYDAIAEGLNRLQRSTLTKKALIVLSDGGDNFSRRKDRDVIEQADLTGALFYAIGIYDPMDGDANPKLLRELAKKTGGESFFPEKVTEIREICKVISHDLRNQYMLAYAPPANSKSDYRKLEVKVKDTRGRKLIVRTRTGYYSKELQNRGSEQ